MKRKDVLAAGGKSATFMGGVGDNDALRNVAPEGTRNEEVAPIEPEKTIRKRFIPTAGVLLVRRDEAKSASKIIVTETMEKEQPAEGIVLEIGTGCGDLRSGDNVVFGKYAGAQFKLNGEMLLLMEASEVKGTIVDEIEVIETEVVFPVSVYHDGDCGR
jgi:chaperonin GroES